jgi:hypothetical protein
VEGPYINWEHDYYLYTLTQVTLRHETLTSSTICTHSRYETMSICSLFNNALSVTNTIYSVEWMGDTWMNWEGFGRKRSLLNFEVISRHSPGGTEETRQTPQSDSRSPGRAFNLGSPKYEAEVLTTRPRRSVVKHCISNQRRSHFILEHNGYHFQLKT